MGKENHYDNLKKVLLYFISVHWGDLMKQIKKICHMHFNETFNAIWCACLHSHLIKLLLLF